MPSARYEDFSINTIIGPNTILKGDIETGGFTRIDGSITGDVTAKGRVVIGEKARMKGHVSGTAITIGGVIYGNIVASESLVVLSTALVLGDIITRRIQVDDGCLIQGKVLVCADKESWSNAVSEYRDDEGIKSALPIFAKNAPLEKNLSDRTAVRTAPSIETPEDKPLFEKTADKAAEKATIDKEPPPKTPTYKELLDKMYGDVPSLKETSRRDTVRSGD